MANHLFKKVYFGSGFDPITFSHEEIIKTISCISDNVVIGCLDNSIYKKYHESFNNRLALVQEVLKNDIELSGISIDIVKEETSTYNFIMEYNKTHVPIDTIVMGDDEWNDLTNNKWHNSQELLSNFNFIVFSLNVHTFYYKDKIKPSTSECNIAKLNTITRSTNERKILADKLKRHIYTYSSGIISPFVYRYIIMNNLYIK